MAPKFVRRKPDVNSVIHNLKAQYDTAKQSQKKVKNETLSLSAANTVDRMPPSGGSWGRRRKRYGSSRGTGAADVGRMAPIYKAPDITVQIMLLGNSAAGYSTFRRTQRPVTGKPVGCASKSFCPWDRIVACLRSNSVSLRVNCSCLFRTGPGFVGGIQLCQGPKCQGDARQRAFVCAAGR